MLARIVNELVRLCVRMMVMTKPSKAQPLAAQANCCWFLSLVPAAALLAKKPRKICVGRLTSTDGCGCASPCEAARSAPASLSR